MWMRIVANGWNAVSMFKCGRPSAHRGVRLAAPRRNKLLVDVSHLVGGLAGALLTDAWTPESLAPRGRSLQLAAVSRRPSGRLLNCSNDLRRGRDHDGIWEHVMPLHIAESDDMLAFSSSQAHLTVHGAVGAMSSKAGINDPPAGLGCISWPHRSPEVTATSESNLYKDKLL